ncbi:MAG: hypothetical protein AVO35_11055 [Candidatus Aegiribacteria sp. MLS_C]|nr:MAG: hypothetical protein AVO35_11055 [Candidatus Aegiribacteria sp. MLS_C]
MKIGSTLAAAAAALLLAGPAGGWKVVPLLSYSTSSGVLLGGVVNHNMVPPFSPFAFSTMAYVYTDGSVSAGPQMLIPSGNGVFHAGLNYLADRKNRFYGWGNAGSDETYGEYSAETAEATGSYSFRPLECFLLSLGASCRHSTVYDRTGEDLWAQAPSRRYGSAWTAGPFLMARVSIPGPPACYMAGEAGVQTDGEDVYTDTEVSSAVFVPIGPSTVTGLRIRLGRHTGSGSTPFSFLPSLGGSSGLRGYGDGRFTGDWTLLANLELRQRLFCIRLEEAGSLEFSVVLFGDAGQVADNLGGMGWDRFHMDGGMGFRMSLPEGGALRADFALSPEGLGIQMGLGELF